MSSKAVSPGAALLRTSRVFSLPAQIPSGPSDVARLIGQFGSTSATAPFPTLQSIASPRTSRDRGDWGLKRPLPPNAKRATAEPVVRVKAIDSREQITDYATATDHTMTLRKWQALNVHLTVQSEVAAKQELAGRSVFEDDIDTIDLPVEQRYTAADKRWKFSGPWLGSMTEGQFQAYIGKSVHPRRKEFREFLRAQRAIDLNHEAAIVNPDEVFGRDSADADADAPRKTYTADDVSDADLVAYLHALRNNRPLLYSLVGKFLDLAPIAPSESALRVMARSSSIGQNFLSPLGAISSLAPKPAGNDTPASAPATAHIAITNNPWVHTAPPITHPSAGLSYLRSSAFIDNHPIYGPQKMHPPVTARIVTPRLGNANPTGKLGVAGVITDNPYGNTSYVAINMMNGISQGSGLDSIGKPTTAHHVPGLSMIDPSVPGGSKVPVRIGVANINSQGRIGLTVLEADPESVLVQREMESDETIYGESARLQTARADSAPRRSVYEGQSGTHRVSSPMNYGLDQ